MKGVVQLLAYATYLPAYRVEGLKGRIAASFDEDSTTMAVAAALATGRTGAPAPTLLLATSSPAYLDKTNAAAVHAALGLPRETFAADLIGTARSSMAALRQASTEGGWALMADVRVGRPGSADEKGADGAAAFLFGEEDGIAEVLAKVSLTEEFLDRWREPTSTVGQQWEERFGATRYAPLVKAATTRVLEQAGLDGIDHLVVTSPNSGTRKANPGSPVGFLGSADPGFALASALDKAAPGETILLVSATDGCDALLLEALPALADRRQAVPLAEQLEGGTTVPYLTYLAWRGLVERELPRRPEPDRPAGPPSARGTGWKFGFTGSRCTACGFVHLPPLRVCRGCGAQDAMEPVRGAGLKGHVATYTVDRLAFSPSPPVVDVVVDFDGGGRCSVEVADARPEDLEVGSPVELTFRRLFTAGGVHNYFWKARQTKEQAHG
ncbi:MAG: OB-fold domain-containing protein [Marmoricola sp.]